MDYFIISHIKTKRKQDIEDHQYFINLFRQACIDIQREEDEKIFKMLDFIAMNRID